MSFEYAADCTPHCTPVQSACNPWQSHSHKLFLHRHLRVPPYCTQAAACKLRCNPRHRLWLGRSATGSVEATDQRRKTRRAHDP
jgi:hypothetical protein